VNTTHPALIVLNNTSASYVAEVAAGRFRQGGWTVTSTGRLPGEIVSTVAYYDPEVSGAHKAAQDLAAQYPEIQRVRPRFAELPQGPIVVVLTSDYS
jgi:hypothetical protein